MKILGSHFSIFYLKLIIKIILGKSSKVAKISFLSVFKLIYTPRYKSGTTRINGIEITFADSASFLSMYYEIFVIEIYKFKSDSNPYIVDCGSNIGLSILYFKFLFPNAIIKAYEPDPFIFKILQVNIQSFKFSNVELFELGIWNKEATLDFHNEGADGGRLVEMDHKGPSIKIKTIELFPLINNKIDFLKLDIEGAEYDVIENIQGKLDKVCNLFVEYHSFQKSSQNLHKLLTILNNAGFRYNLQHLGIVSPNPFEKIYDIGGMDNQLNIFAYKTTS